MIQSASWVGRAPLRDRRVWRSPPAQYGITRQSSARSLCRMSRIGRMLGWLGWRDVEWEELGGPLRMERR